MKRILGAFYAKLLSADLVEIQMALESKTLQQHLMDYGLAPENAMAKINGFQTNRPIGLRQTSTPSRKAAAEESVTKRSLLSSCWC